MKYTTEDCKKYLVTIYKDTNEEGWKRVKKYNDEQKRVNRDFEYNDGRLATIIETPEGLKDKNILNVPKVSPFAKIRDEKGLDPKKSYSKNNDKNDFKIFLDKVTGGNLEDTTKSSIEKIKDLIAAKEIQEKINQAMNNNFDSMFKIEMKEMPSIYQKAIVDNTSLEQMIRPNENLLDIMFKGVLFKDLVTIEEKFLYTVYCGPQWDETKDNVSTSIYHKIINKESLINNMINKDIDLPNLYLTNIVNNILMMESMDEGYLPFHIMSGDECIKDMTIILKDIIILYDKAGKDIKLDKDLLEGALYKLNSIKELFSMNDAGEQWTEDEVRDTVEILISYLKEKEIKKGMKP